MLVGGVVIGCVTTACVTIGCITLGSVVPACDGDGGYGHVGCVHEPVHHELQIVGGDVEGQLGRGAPSKEQSEGASAQLDVVSGAEGDGDLLHLGDVAEQGGLTVGRGRGGGGSHVSMPVWARVKYQYGCDSNISMRRVKY